MSSLAEVLDAKSSTANVSLDADLGSNSSVLANQTAALIDSVGLLVDNATIHEKLNATNSLLDNLSDIPKAEPSANESALVSQALTSSELPQSRSDTEITMPPLKKKPRMKVIWLDAPAKSDSVQKINSANLSATLQKVNSTNSTLEVSETDSSALPKDRAAFKTVIEKFQESVLREAADANLTGAASNVNISIPSIEMITEDKPEAIIPDSLTLDDDSIKGGIDDETNVASPTDSNLPENPEAPALVADPAALLSSNDNSGLTSVSSPSPLLPDDIFAPPSSSFEPGPPPAPLLPPIDSAVPVSPKFEPGFPPAPLLPEVNNAGASPVFEARSPPAPLLPNESAIPGSPKFEPGSPPAPLLPKDTFSPASSYKPDSPLSSQDFDPTKPPTNFGSFVQEIAKDMMPDFGGASAKPAEEFGSFVREVAKGGMPMDESKGTGTPKPASEFGAYVDGTANDSVPIQTEQGGTASNPTVIVAAEDKSGSVAEEWDSRKPPSNFGSFVNQLAKSKMSGDGSDFDAGAGIVDTAQDEQGWEDNFSGPEPYRGEMNQDSMADVAPDLSQRSTNAFDQAETWDPWKFDVMSQTLGKSSRFPSSTLEDFEGSGLEMSGGGRSAPSGRDTPSSFERAETWDPWKFDVMSQTLGKSTIFPSSNPDEMPASEPPVSDMGDSPGFRSQAAPDASFDRAKNWDPWKFDVMSQTLGKSNTFPSSSPEDFANTGISTSSTSQGSGSSRGSSTRSSFERAETWDPWKFDVLSQTLGKSNHFPSSSPQDFSSDQQEEAPAPQPGQRMISYEKTETWDPRTFNVLSQTLGKSTSFPAPEQPSAPSSEPSWPVDPPQSSGNAPSGFSRAEKWDPWAFDVLKQTLGKSTVFPSSAPQDFSGDGGGGGSGYGNDWLTVSQESRPTSPIGPSSSTYSPQGVFNRPQTVSGTFDPSGSLSGAGRAQGAAQGSSSSWSGSSSASSGSIADYSQPNGVFDPTSQSGVTSYLQDATRAHFGSAPPSTDEDTFPVQNSQLSGDYSESRFKILTGEAAPLHWDPVKETWVEQGTGKPVEATTKAKIAPPKKQEQVSVAPAVGSQKQNDRQSRMQAAASPPPTEKGGKASSESTNPTNLDRKNFKSSNKQAPSVNVYNSGTSREELFGKVEQSSPRKTSNQSRRSQVMSTKGTSKDEGRPTSAPSKSESKIETRRGNPSRNTAEERQRVRGNQRGDETYRSNSNRPEIFKEFLRSNYQPGSLRLDIPENIFGAPPSRMPDYVDNTANRGFGPFQGGWGRPPPFQENSAENVYIDLPSEEDQQPMPLPSNMYDESPPFERSDMPHSDLFGVSPQFDQNDIPFSDLYGDAPPFQPDATRLDAYGEANSPESYTDNLLGQFSDSYPPQLDDASGDSRERFDDGWQNNGSYLDSMRRPGDDEPNGSNGVFDWGSYVSEQGNIEASSSRPDFPAEDPGGYYIASPTLYDDSGLDDYPPVISFSEASRPQMRSYLDSLYKSSQSNGYWDSSSSSEQSDSFSDNQQESSFLESPEQQFYEARQQASSFDAQDQSLLFSAPQESPAQTTAYFTNTEWNPKEGADPNQNPFARYIIYAEPGSQPQASPPSSDVSTSLDTSYSNGNSNSNNDDKSNGSNSSEDPPAPKRGSQVYPEVKNSWFGGGSYLDSMNQRNWDDDKNK